MKTEDADLLRHLLTRVRVLSLAVVDGAHQPVVGMVPFAVEPGFAATLVHVSRLAPHGKELRDGAPFAVLIQGSDDGEIPPGQIPRVRLNGTAELLNRGTSAYAAACAVFLERFPDSELTFGLGDFDLYRLAFERGRLVAGFARTVNLRPESLIQLARETSG